MSASEVLHINRVILAHFDSYSAALLFARWEHGLLGQSALSASATPVEPPLQIGVEYDGHAVLQAVVERYCLNPAEIVRMAEFDAWFNDGGELIRVHVLRFTGFEAPVELIGAQGGVFRAISALRGAAMSELLLLREVFNILVGGNQRATT
jgi:hypothetical protein